MQWWDEVVAWLSTESGRLVLLGGVVPFVAVLTAGLLAAWIARGSVRRVLAQRDRETRAAAVGLVVDAARQASVWSSSSSGERVLIDRAIAEADLALRLLPTRGARLAADWSAHEIAGLRRASAVFSLEFDQPLADLRDRLVAWHRRPRRARKLFEADLLRWRGDAAEEATAAEVLPSPAQWTPSSPASAAETPLVSTPLRHRSPETRPAPAAVQPPTDEEFSRPRAGVGTASP